MGGRAPYYPRSGMRVLLGLKDGIHLLISVGMNVALAHDQSMTSRLSIRTVRQAHPGTAGSGSASTTAAGRRAVRSGV